MEPCKHEELIESWKKDIPRLKSNNTESRTRLKMSGTIIGIIITLLVCGVGLYARLSAQSTARAQDKAEATITEIKQEVKENENDIQEIKVDIGKIQTDVKNMNEKIDKVDEKQDKILDAIKDLKKDG